MTLVILFSSSQLETIKILLAKSGINTAYYKDSFLKRRTNAAFHRSPAKSHEEYLTILKQNPEEIKRLSQFLSINVTRFFRDLDTFQLLEKHYLPQLVAMKKNDENKFGIKVWSIGCANGSEPYTLAILFSRILGTPLVPANVKIIGSDINPELLKFAKKGIFPVSNMTEIPSSILEQYFIKISPELYQIIPKIKKMVQFRLNDIVKDPPYKQQDLITFRNVLIYFSKESQRMLFDKLEKSLNRYGMLIIGRTELLPVKYMSKFMILDRKHRIYQKNIQVR